MQGGGSWCDAHQRKEQKQYDAARGSANSRGYNSRWQKARATFLRRNPLCMHCKERGLLVVATVVDHIKPHRGDQELFWDTSNWQSLCAPCHDGWKQAQERAGLA